MTLNKKSNQLAGYSKWCLSLLLIFAFGCGDDDQPDPMPPAPAPDIEVRIVSVDPANNLFTLQNFGSAAVDISDFRLCSKFQYTPDLEGLTIVTGSLNLAAGATVTLSDWPLDEAGADLGLYQQTSDFEDADTMQDFVQWVTAGNGRESVAVQKGIWGSGEFIEGNGPYTYTGNGQQNGVDQWEASSSTVGPIIRILSVDPAADVFVLQNFGDEALDISDYRFCSRFNYTSDLSSLTINQGSLNLEPDATVEISGWDVDDTSADFGLYLPSGGFSDPDALVDFVQYGAGGIGREPVAVAKDIWSAGDFLTGTGPFTYQGDGTQNGLAFWD